MQEGKTVILYLEETTRFALRRLCIEENLTRNHLQGFTKKPPLKSGLKRKQILSFPSLRFLYSLPPLPRNKFANHFGFSFVPARIKTLLF